MAPPHRAIRLAAGSLGPLTTTIGSGGQGVVYLVPGSPPRAYKEYSAPLDPGGAQALTAMVDFAADLPRADAAMLRARAAWPAEVVDRDGRVAGFTMACVPDSFRIRMLFPSGPQLRLGQMQLLLNDPAFLQARGLAVDDAFRIAVLRDIAETLELFHRLGVAVGDLSPNNLFFSFSARPRCFFIDCDAMRVQGSTVFPQVDTPDWETPAGEALATPSSDCYKFALLCARLFAGDQSSTDADAVRRAGTAVHALTVRALRRDPRQRPTLQEWHIALHAAVPARRAAVPAGPSLPVRIARSAGRRLARRLRRTSPGRLIRNAVLAVTLLFCLTQVSWTGLMDAALDTIHSSGSQQTAEEQARGFAQLLESSGHDRQKVIKAVSDTKKCKRLSESAEAFREASNGRKASRERAVALQADRLSGGTELRQRLIEALTVSQAADDAYRRWAVRAAGTRCRASVMTGPDRRAGDAESTKATALKNQVAELWNPLARAYGYRELTFLDI